MAYRDGYKSAGMIVISGPHARKKAEKFAEIFWQKYGADFLETSTEYFGWNACPHFKVTPYGVRLPRLGSGIDPKLIDQLVEVQKLPIAAAKKR